MLRKNLLYSLITTGSRVISGFFLLFFLARILEVKDFGLLTYSMAFSNLMVLVVDYGYNIKLSRDTGAHPDKIPHLMHKSLMVKLILLGAFILITGIMAALGMWSMAELGTVLCFSFAAVMNSFANYFLIPFKSINRFDKEALYIALNNSLIFITALTLGYQTKNVMYIGIGFLVIKSLFALATFREYQTKFHFDRIPFSLKKEFLDCLPFAVHVMIGAFYLNIDTMFLKEYKSLEEVAIYQSGMRLLSAATIFIAVINSVLLPRISNSYVHNKQQFHKDANRFNLIGFGLGLGAFLTFFLFPKELVHIVYGEKYIELIPILAGFGIIIFLRYFGLVYGTLLTISDNQKVRTIAVTATLIFIIVGDMLFIPDYGIKAALWVLLIAHILLNMVYLFFTIRTFGSLFINPKYLFNK